MKIDTQMRGLALRKAAAEAARYEAMGFDAVWTFEAAHNPFFPLLQAAMATERLQIGTNIAVAFARSPYVMAQAAWDLQEASGGRLHLGIGTQVRAHVERRFSMPFDHPAPRIADYVRCMRAIWDSFQNGSRPAYEGPFYRFTLINPAFNPGPIAQPQIPVYIAGVNRRMCEAAGEVADGFHVHPVHSVGYLRDVVRPALEDGARRAGRSIGDVALYASVFAVTGESEAERSASEARVRQQIAFYASTPNYRALLEYHGQGGIAKTLSEHMRRGEMEAMARLIPDSLMEECAVFAEPSRLGSALRRRYDGLLQRVSLYFPMAEGGPDEAGRRFVEDFRAAG